MRIERNVLGEQVFVCESRSGRRYTGATPEEAERKQLLSTLHAFARDLPILRELCLSNYTADSFGKLTLEQMRELKTLALESKRNGEKLTQGNAMEPRLTDAQRKRIVRLGLYVLGPHYGNDWFWRKCKEWIPRFRDAKRIELGELTNQEAWRLIQRLEKIEKRLKSTGEMTDE